MTKALWIGSVTAAQVGGLTLLNDCLRGVTCGIQQLLCLAWFTYTGQLL